MPSDLHIISAFSRKRDVSRVIDDAVAAIESANESLFVARVFEIDGFAKRLCTRGLRWREAVTLYAKEALMRRGVRVEVCWRCDACAALTVLVEQRCSSCATPKPMTVRVPIAVSKLALRGEHCWKKECSF